MDLSIILLRFALIAVLFSFGVHQMIYPKQWQQYIPDNLMKLLPVSFEIVMRSHAGVNIILGLLLVGFPYPVALSWIVFVWLLSIVPFAFIYKWQIGVRDLAIALAAASLIVLVV